MRWMLITAILHLVAGIVGMQLARRRRDYLPVAVFLLGTAIADLGLVALTLGAPTALPTAPLTGLTRFVAHVRQGLYLVWPFGFTTLVITVFSGRFLRVIPLAYVVTLAALVLGYPTLGGELLRRVYLGIELAALAVAVAAITQWAWRRESPTLPHVMTILLLSGEAGLLFGPWHHDIFAGWEAGRIMYSTVYVVLIGLQGGVLWKSSESSSSERS
jgi:hypothetical protein